MADKIQANLAVVQGRPTADGPTWDLLFGVGDDNQRICGFESEEEAWEAGWEKCTINGLEGVPSL